MKQDQPDEGVAQATPSSTFQDKLQGDLELMMMANRGAYRRAIARKKSPDGMLAWEREGNPQSPTVKRAARIMADIRLGEPGALRRWMLHEARENQS